MNQKNVLSLLRFLSLWLGHGIGCGSFSSVAILLNQRTDPASLAYDSIKTVIDPVITGIPLLNQ